MAFLVTLFKALANSGALVLQLNNANVNYPKFRASNIKNRDESAYYINESVLGIPKENWVRKVVERASATSFFFSNRGFFFSSKKG